MSEYLSKEKIKGENFEERMSRFGLIVENAHGNWDLSDRDENAIRTANELLLSLQQRLGELEKENERLKIELALAKGAKSAKELHKNIKGNFRE